MKKQFYLTPAEGKRLIAKALAADERVMTAAKEHTLVIVSGTTNGYIAEEVMKKLGMEPTDRLSFFRGIFKGPKGKDLTGIPRDVVIRKGELILDRTIDEIEPELKTGDMILKGANAVYLKDRQAGVVIGNTAYGTLVPVSKAYFGRRVEVIIPVGLEKRVDCPITTLVSFVNAPDCTGTRLALAPGAPYTELDALESLGVKACLLAAGGVSGFEGSVMLGVEGDEMAMTSAEALIKSVKGEPMFGE